MPVPDRVCACHCGQSLEGRRPSVRYATDACRARAWKARNGYRDPRARQAYRNASQTKRKPSIRISYRKAVDAVAAELARRRDRDARSRATEILNPLLTDKQRQHLEEAA